MKPSLYAVGTGMHPHPQNQEQFSRWLYCLKRHASPVPERVYVLGVGGARPNEANMKYAKDVGIDLRVITTEGNPGHVGQLLSGEKNHLIGGWSAGIITLAMLAYNDELDFVYAESDVLNFGPWVEWLFGDLGDNGMMTFGAEMSRAPFMACSQSLVLIKHGYIVDFVGRYVGHGPETQVAHLPESAWQRMRDDDGRIRRSFWVDDRCRPIRWDQSSVSAQKLTKDELDEAKRRGLL